jgi:hypothetical protein
MIDRLKPIINVFIVVIVLALIADYISEDLANIIWIIIMSFIGIIFALGIFYWIRDFFK